MAAYIIYYVVPSENASPLSYPCGAAAAHPLKALLLSLVIFFFFPKLRRNGGLSPIQFVLRALYDKNTSYDVYNMSI